MSAKDLKDLIRPLKARSEKPRVRQPFESRALASIIVRERLETVIEPYIVTLREAVPELLPTRRFYEGAWVVGLAADLPHGKRKERVYHAFSRIEFAIEVDVSRRAVTLTCRGTVFDRDLDATRMIAGSDEESWAELRAWVEARCLHFAGAFFAQERRSAAAA